MLRRCRDGLIAVGLFSMGINLLVLTVSIYMLQVYDRVLPGRSVETLIYLTIIAAGALGTMGALDLLRSRILVRLGIWIDRTLSPTLFGRGLENMLRGLPYRTEALRDLNSLAVLSRRGRNHGAVRCALVANFSYVYFSLCTHFLDCSPLAVRQCSSLSP